MASTGQGLGGPKSWPGHYGEEKNLPFPGIEPQPSSSYPVAIWTELSYNNNNMRCLKKLYTHFYKEYHSDIHSKTKI
jgi:hypothetical protein